MTDKIYKPTPDELKTVLDNHMHWLREDRDGWENMRADLSSANLRFANLSSANLRSADLSSANLRSADLRSADLRFANLRFANGIEISCPSDGAFIAWKKAWHDDECVIVKLQIPEDARRLSATGRKCRCDKAVVLGIYGMDGEEYDSANSDNSRDFVYRVGETVTPDSFDDNRWNECSHGIHFFITRKEAEEYEI